MRKDIEGAVLAWVNSASFTIEQVPSNGSWVLSIKDTSGEVVLYQTYDKNYLISAIASIGDELLYLAQKAYREGEAHA